MIFGVGCSDKGDDTDKIAYISQSADSEYERTFDELGLGRLFDFNFKLPRSDESWVKIWVEGYKDGEPVEPFPLIKLSYGLVPKEVEEGNLGAGILHPGSDSPQLFIYSKGARTGPVNIDDSLFSDTNVRGWDYAIEGETVGLNSGEEKVLAVYRLGKGSMRTRYNYQDPDELDEMISEDKVVLIFMISIEEKEEV
ncbi:hypothetical protein CDO51_12580 [Natranaerobius trueperi]|uniref:Uncharacterized protein n=1 Tax=Natranaerobius trueperi TaxID=759412 RepID=A0A226BWP1_9FIRM|nr:hypothetical protein CDO51_12580 [Natranaerobius trueperi]